MGTMAEEIFSQKLNREVHAGEIVVAEVDFIMSNDSTTALAVKAWKEIGKPLFDRNRIVIHFDHFFPSPNINCSIIHQGIRAFVQEQGIRHFYHEGIGHQAMVEKGFIVPGGIVIGADSHACAYGALSCFGTGVGSTDLAVSYVTGKNWFVVPKTLRFEIHGKFSLGVYPMDLMLQLAGRLGADGANYRACEFGGTAIRSMCVDDRLTLTNMSVEIGGKVGLIETDNRTFRFLNHRTTRALKAIQPRNPQYEDIIDVDLKSLQPVVAVPHQVDQIKPAEALEGIEIDEFFLGSCTCGKLSDLRTAAKILAGKKVHRESRMVVNPASNEIYTQAERQGILRTFRDAGAVVCNPGCGVCVGSHQGVLGPGEKALASMSRNFRGRMGSPDAEIYLASPATVAVSSIYGRITDPRKNFVRSQNLRQDT
jgi:homoaconitate hydratase family protein